jgi:hypothetical protein
MAGPRPELELCAGVYRAQATPGGVVIFAEGTHPTSGFSPFLYCESEDPHSPVLSLWHVRPSGPVLQVTTPFSVWTAFQTLCTVARAFIRDANGTHEIAVERTGDAATGRWGG